MRTLFVGESSPAGGTHFYKANSNLFRATRSAFVRALGEGVPNGARFLEWFRGQGNWLVDLADRPVNRITGDEREAAVRSGVSRLAELLGELRPGRIVGVKASIAPYVREAASAAQYRGEILELPFPVRQWRVAYEQQLSEALRRVPSASPDGGKPERARMTLHEAIDEVLDAGGNEPMTARAIAEEIARRGSLRRPSDGLAPPASQINARVSNRHYRDHFERVDRRIRMRKGRFSSRTPSSG